MPQALEITTDFTYLRLHHGPHSIGYSPRTLDTWAERINGWRAKGLNVYAYFNNDADAWAIRNARTLRSLVKGKR
jgi:uncharacterized protein YecE (DUF72 family)